MSHIQGRDKVGIGQEARIYKKAAALCLHQG